MRFLFPLIAFFALSAVAQTGSLRGVVSDPSGSVIPNVAVRVTGQPGGAHTARTDAQGQYRFNGLPPGVYAVHAEAPGFTVFDQTGYDIPGGQVKSLDIALTLHTQNDQVTVAAEGAAVIDTDPSNNAGALVLQKADLDALPDDRDDLTADLQALAGPAAGPGGGQFFIDGFTGGRMPAKSTIREIRINQNPFAAQFDRPGQGRVEIFTKPGSEELHGEILFQITDSVLNTRNPFLSSKPRYQRRQFEGEIGGRLGKKTSYSGDFERRDVDDNTFINAVVLDTALNPVPLMQVVQSPAGSFEGNARMDRQLTTNHTLTVRYGYAWDNTATAGIGGFSLAERAYGVADHEHTFQVLETGVLNQHTVNETRFRLRRQTSANSGYSVAPIISVPDAFVSGGSQSGNSFDNRTYREIQNFTSWVHGSHTVRYGGLARINSFENQAMDNYAGTFSFTSIETYRLTLTGIAQKLSAAAIRAMGGGPSQFTLSAGQPLAALSQTDFGLFSQDDWRLRQNFTLSVGLRYEAQTHSSDHSDLAPRLGFAWAIGGQGKTPAKNVVRGGFGVFYDRLGETLSLTALRQDGIRQQQFLIPNPDFYPSIPSAVSLTASAQPQTIRRTDTNWRAPTMLQAGLGFERQLPKHVTVASNFLRTQGFHALRSRNINAPLSSGGPLPYGGVNAIYLYETSGVYRQNQWITNLNARINPRLTFTASYVLGSAIANTDGAGTFPVNQYDLSGELAPAAFNVKQRIQANGAFGLKYGFRLSPFLTVASGRPYNLTAGRDLNGDGLFTDRPSFAIDASLPGVRNTPYGLLNPNPRPGDRLISRNAGVGPGLVSANLRLSKAFNLGRHDAGKDSDRQVVLAVNARNFANHPNFGAPVGNLSSSLFGQSTSLLGPSGGGGGVSGNRRVDLQVRFTF